MQIFTQSSIERLLALYIKYDTDVLELNKIVDELGTVIYYSKKRLEDMGIIEKDICFSNEKMRNVVCYKLTDKGKKIVDALKQMYDVLGIQP